MLSAYFTVADARRARRALWLQGVLLASALWILHRTTSLVSLSTFALATAALAAAALTASFGAWRATRKLTSLVNELDR